MLSARTYYVGRWNPTSVHTFDATAHKRRCAYERNRSRGFTVVVLQDAAKSMFAFYLAWIKRNDIALIVRFCARQRQQPIAESLMRPALMIIGNVFGNNVVEVCLAKDQEVVQGFLFE